MFRIQLHTADLLAANGQRHAICEYVNKFIMKPFSLCRKELVYDMGTVKLADFGLSKTLPVNKHAAFDLDDKFKLTGETGSYRFMAREVFVHEAYNNKVPPFM